MGMDTKLLKQKILDLAIRGKLVPQDPNDEPASVLLERIRAEREKLIAEGKLKRTKTTSDNRHYENGKSMPFEIPVSWEWCKVEDLFDLNPKNCIDDNTKVGFIPMELVSAGFGYSHTYNEQRWGNVKKGYCHFQNGDIGIAKISPCFENRKSTIFYDLPNGFGAGTTELVILRGHIVCSEFYLNLFQSSWYISEGTKYFKGNVGQQRVKKDIFTTLLIPLPPLEEQKRIVKALQMWFAAADELELSKTDLQDIIKLTKTRVLGLAIHGKLVPQDPNDEPAVELLKRINPDFVPCDTSQYENLPQGWVVCKLEDIVDYEQPTQYLVQSTNYSDNYKTPVLTAGKSFILGYTNETTGIFDKLPTIIFDDFTTDSRFVVFPFKVKSSAMKLLQVNKEINIRFVAYFMSITRLVGDTHKRYWISEYSKIPIPLPPIKEQNRIVQAIQDIEAKLNEITTEL